MQRLKKRSKIVVAMSGGVDSSTSAALLKKQGHDVIGIALRVWDYSEQSKNGTCCAPRDFEDARRVAERWNFPFYVLDFEEKFRETVIDNFLSEYEKGRTPNPCVQCNNHVKFSRLFNKAMVLGADYIATGHYAVIRACETSGVLSLKKGRDSHKDQSYFLFGMTQKQLAHTLFPVGHLYKDEVRLLAEMLELHLAEKRESQDICFIQGKSYPEFVEGEWKRRGFAPVKRGPIEFSDGTHLGFHEGIHRFTIGQKKGLGIATGEPLYVIRINAERNALVVGREEELFQKECVVSHINWIERPTLPFAAQIQIRYRNKPKAAQIAPLTEEWSICRIQFEEPQKSVTPGQVGVFYRGDHVLGGGFIQ